MTRYHADALSNATAIAELKIRHARALQAENVRVMVRQALGKFAAMIRHRRAPTSDNAKV